MRVIYFLRADAGRFVGGPTEQVRRYAEAVRAQGHEAVVWTSHATPPGRFDVAHLMNLDWPVETARQLQVARRCADRIVLSPIHHRREWVEAFHARGRKGMARMLAGRVGLDVFERLRNVFLAAPAPRLWSEALTQAALGVARRQAEILDGSDAWCLLADAEADSLERDFAPAPRERFIVRNGAEWSDEEPSGLELPAEFVLCVSRVEGRKNQLGLARVLRELDLAGVFVGSPNMRHRAYVREFEATIESSPNLTWFQSIPRERLLPLYGRARLHVLASWYEVVPIVDLEAALAGCRTVTTTRGHGNEYLGESALYWEPDSGDSGLRDIVSAGLDAEPPDRAELRRTLSWEAVTSGLTERYARVGASS